MNLTRIGAAIAVAGTLDIASAMVLTASKGKPIAGMLRGVASGPFGDQAVEWGMAGAAFGLVTHFAIMAVMVVAFALAIERLRVTLHPAILGPAYGILLYLIMYWIVLPLRWPGVYPVIGLRGILVPVAIHIVLVGMPIAFILLRSGSAARAVAAK